MMDNTTFYRRRLVELMQQTTMLREDENAADYSEGYLRRRCMMRPTAHYSRLIRTLLAWIPASFHGTVMRELQESRGKLDELLEMAALVFGTDDAALVGLNCNAGVILYVLGDHDGAARYYNESIRIAMKDGDRELLLEPEEGLYYCTRANANAHWSDLAATDTPVAAAA